MWQCMHGDVPGHADVYGLLLMRKYTVYLADICIALMPARTDSTIKIRIHSFLLPILAGHA